MGSTCPQTSSFLHVLCSLPSAGAKPIWGSTWPDALLETTSGLTGAAPGEEGQFSGLGERRGVERPFPGCAG